MVEIGYVHQPTEISLAQELEHQQDVYTKLWQNGPPLLDAATLADKVCDLPKLPGEYKDQFVILQQEVETIVKSSKTDSVDHLDIEEQVVSCFRNYDEKLSLEILQRICKVSPQKQMLKEINPYQMALHMVLSIKESLAEQGRYKERELAVNLAFFQNAITSALVKMPLHNFIQQSNKLNTAVNLFSKILLSEEQQEYTKEIFRIRMTGSLSMAIGLLALKKFLKPGFSIKLPTPLQDVNQGIDGLILNTDKKIVGLLQSKSEDKTPLTKAGKEQSSKHAQEAGRSIFEPTEISLEAHKKKFALLYIGTIDISETTNAMPQSFFQSYSLGKNIYPAIFDENGQWINKPTIPGKQLGSDLSYVKRFKKLLQSNDPRFPFSEEPNKMISMVYTTINWHDFGNYYKELKNPRQDKYEVFDKLSTQIGLFYEWKNNLNIST